MSESREKIAHQIQGLSTAVITAYVSYISKHRDIDSASVVTASALYVAAIVDSVTFQEDDPSQSDMMKVIAEAAMKMLEDTNTVRDYVQVIFKAVMAEEKTRR